MSTTQQPQTGPRRVMKNSKAPPEREQIHVRVATEIMDTIREMAADSRRTIAAELELLLEKAIAAEREVEKPAKRRG